MTTKFNFFRKSRAVLLFSFIVLSTACTNSLTAWKLFYGQLDYFISKELLSYADFDEEQKGKIRVEVDNAVRWHRQTELPRYAKLLKEFQVRFLVRSANPSDIEWLFTELNDVGLELDKNSPLLPLLPMIAGLSDSQVTQIKNYIDNDFIEAEQEWAEQTDKERAVKSTETMTTFFKRLGLKLSSKQKVAIEQRLKQRKLSYEIQQQHWRTWSDNLLEILQARKEGNFNDRFSDHHFARIDLMKTQEPTYWQHDRQLFQDLLLDLFASLSSSQKATMNQRVNKLQVLAIELSQQK